MKTVPPGLAAMLASGVTTLCRCWRIQRQDGEVFGFTNHDRTLSFAGIDFHPETGFTASESEDRLGLAVDTQEAAGILSSSAISEADIALGLWDNAKVTVFVVDWSDVTNRVIERAGVLGEVARGPLAYSVEVRSLAHHLNQSTGRTYQRQCDAIVGDSRCKVNLADPAFSAAGTVVSAAGLRLLTVAGLDGFASSWFSRGVLTWTSGANQGARQQVDRHFRAADMVRLGLWQDAALPIEAGDGFTVTAGCDTSWATCRAKFANGSNFRGYPHIPGNDFVLSVAKQENDNDGEGIRR